ncbi:hypothetical protein [Geosporobacter ferrireducens]|nr:hypothetical protein [Geosporobacter ferrireducens]
MCQNQEILNKNTGCIDKTGIKTTISTQKDAKLKDLNPIGQTHLP